MNLINLLFGLFYVVLSVWADTEEVPVILWSRTALPYSPSLKHVGSVAFEDLLRDSVGSKQPIIVVFLEENLSNEDFSLRHKQDQSLHDDLQTTIGDKNVLYLPSVSHPMKAIKSLEADGYDKVRFEGDVPTDLENPTILIVPLHDESSEERSANLRAHYKIVKTVHNKLAQSYSNVVAIYTGRSNSWVDDDKVVIRVRRADEAPTPAPLLIRHEGIVAIASAISFKNDQNDEPVVVTGVSSVSASNTSDSILLTATLQPSGKITFVLRTSQARQWALQSIALDEQALVPRDLDTWAPVGWSWACSGQVTFRANPANNTKYTGSINITGLQIQPDVDENNKFGQPMDCVPYFSTPIWTGLAVTFLLLAILSWGLMMLMDINTNDRFDDPKGKTITISATD